MLVTLSSKTDPLWRDYEAQCGLTSSDNSSGSTAIINPGYTSNNDLDLDRILIKREDGEKVGVAETSSITPPEFSTVFPDSSSHKSSTMWEDIASSIKKLDPDHADVLLEATPTLNNGATPPTSSLPPVSTVVSGGGPEYYHYNSNSGQNFTSEQDLFNNTRLNSHSQSNQSSTLLYSPGSTYENSHHTVSYFE